MTETLATVAMTAFNAEDTIECALASALAQDWRPLEILVVDDASSDATVDRVAVFASRHPEVCLVRHEHNLGVANARNTLLKHAAGEFVIFFDDDDVSVPHRVSTQIGRIRAYEDRFQPNGPVMCHSARRQTMPDGGERTEPTMGMNGDSIAPHGHAVVERVLTGRPLPDGYGALATCSQAARRSAYEVVGGFDTAFRRGEDTDLALRLALAGAHFVGIAEPLVHQTMTLAPEKTLAAERDAILALLDKHQLFFSNSRAYAFARQWADLKYTWIGGQRLQFGLGLASLALASPIQTAKRLVYALPMSQSRAGQRRLHRHSEAAGVAT